MLTLALFAIALLQPPEAPDAEAPIGKPMASDAPFVAPTKAELAQNQNKLKFDFGIKPQTEEEKRAAANAAAIARADQAGKDAAAPPGAWPDDSKVRCKTTDAGFVCGNSDKALEPNSPSRQALDALLKPK